MRRLFAILAAAAALGLSHPSAADAPRTPAGAARAPARGENVAQAKALFNAGAQAYAAGDFRGAIQAFAEAYKLAARPAILFSMAQAHRRQYALDQQPTDLREAIRLYRDYVAQVPKGGRRADAALALAELDPIAARLAERETDEPAPEIKLQTRVAVSSPTAGATVSIDGGPPAPAPLMTEVTPGKHRVRIHAEGHFDQEREVDARPGGVFPIDVTLVERLARLTIAAPEAAQIALDGGLVGVAPLAKPIETPSGRHVVTITLRGHKAWTRQIDLRRGEARALRADLDVSGQRIGAYAFWIAGAGTAGLGVVATAIALDAEASAAAVLDERAHKNISTARLAEYDSAVSRRDDWRRVAAIGYGAGVALGFTGLLLYAFDEPGPDTRPLQRDDRPSTPAPRPAETIVEVAAAPVGSPDLVGVSLAGLF